VGADQYLLPHLGAQARILLDRFVASGSAGVSGRDAVDWVLSRLIQLRYVEESSVDDATFVCTAAGRYRWQIEMMADERRGAVALHRQLIRRRLDERFTRLGIDTSTALMATDPPPEPRLHRRVLAPWNPPPQAKMRLSSPFAAVFAATAAALVVVSASPDAQKVWDLLVAVKPHPAALLADQPQANAGQTVLVGLSATAAVAAPVVLHPEKAVGHALEAANVAPISTQRIGTIDTVAPALKDVSVPNRTLTRIELAGREGFAVVDAVSPDGGAILNSAATAAALMDAAVREIGLVATDLATDTECRFRSTAAALIDTAASESGQIANGATTDIERSFQPIAAALLQAAAVIGRTVSRWHAGILQVRDGAPALVVAATESPSEPEQSAELQPALASHTETESLSADSVPASPNERVTATDPAVRRGKANVDPQHAAVERLNTLSLAAAQRGEVWRPNSRPM